MIALGRSWVSWMGGGEGEGLGGREWRGWGREWRLEIEVHL